jgi:hypothetical protein
VEFAKYYYGDQKTDEEIKENAKGKSDKICICITTVKYEIIFLNFLGVG